MNSSQHIDSLVVDRVNEGVFNVNREVFRDPDIFDLEIEHIFEGSWVFVGLECHVPKANDYITTWVGRAPVVISRDSQGELHCFYNSCRHRGAAVFQTLRGNRKYHACPYHGWVYDSGGCNINIKDREGGGYPPAFDLEGHGLKETARFGNYRGFLFASLNADVPSLEDHLGDTRRFLDLVVDQGPEGIETVPGMVSYTYNGNWKMQVENGLDLYHFTSTHPSYIQVLKARRARRKDAAESGSGSIYEDMAAQQESKRGSLSFAYGHVAYWGDNPSTAERPIAAAMDEIRARVGDTAAAWMLKVRNLVIYPNLQIVENASLQLRVIRPIAVDQTEVTTYCLGPRGESRPARRRRIRQYEDFYNPSGLATPDDTAVYEACQRGYGAHRIQWQQGYLRGMTVRRRGGDERSLALGVQPVESVTGRYDLADETCFHAGYREWLRLLLKGIGAAARIVSDGGAP